MWPATRCPSKRISKSDLRKRIRTRKSAKSAKKPTRGSAAILPKRHLNSHRLNIQSILTSRHLRLLTRPRPRVKVRRVQRARRALAKMTNKNRLSRVQQEMVRPRVNPTRTPKNLRQSCALSAARRSRNTRTKNGVYRCAMSAKNLLMLILIEGGVREQKTGSPRRLRRGVLHRPRSIE